MFRKTDKNKQLNMFSSPSQQLRGRSQRFYDKDNSWHNVFREQIILQIDEGIFKDLFVSDDGAPNASICVLVAMSILKEGHGWSDEQLFDRFPYGEYKAIERIFYQRFSGEDKVILPLEKEKISARSVQMENYNR